MRNIALLRHADGLAISMEQLGETAVSNAVTNTKNGVNSVFTKNGKERSSPHRALANNVLQSGK